VGVLKSIRAKKLLENLSYYKESLGPGMKKFPGSGPDLYFEMELENEIVKNLSFFGPMDDVKKVLFESMATLLINRPISKLDTFSLRELEAYLRDKNSEVSLEEMTENDDIYLKKVFQWLKTLSKKPVSKDYSFHSEKGLFRDLKLADKIKEIRAFLNSPLILTLYRDTASPELVDVEGMTVYINAPYGSQKEKELFEELHLLGVEAFQDENLNFIPES
jgi:hypothetical protein